MTGLHRKLLRDLWALRAQVFTLAILVVCGVAVLVSSWSSYESLQVAKAKYYGEFRFADVFAELVRAPSSELERLNRMQGVEITESRIIKDGLVDVAGQIEPALGRFISWRGAHQRLNLIYLRQGRFPRPGAHLEVVVHESFAEAHRLKIGDQIKALLGGQKRTLSISGVGISPEYVYALSPIAPLPDDKHFGVFWLRHEDLESFTGMSGAFNSVLIKITEGTSVSELKREIDLVLSPFGGIQSYDRTKQVSNMFVEDEIRQQRVVATVMPAIFLAVAAFILNVVLSRLIALHRAQIATLKSLGYGAWPLTWHYFQLITLILLIGIPPALLAGHGIGQWYAKLYRDFFRFPAIDFSLSPTAIIFGILAGLLPGWLGSLSSLIQVFALKPAEALRPPSPPNFQRSLFERLGVIGRWDLFSKMILRTLLFRPYRLFLNVLGIAAALAILIEGSFWTDMLDSMMDRQFQQMRREDLTVRLANPRSSGVFSEIRQIPGVLLIEGERTQAVRLQFKNFKKEISLLGWDRGAQLSRVLDGEGRAVAPVSGGVLLSRYFETEYGMKLGDQIEFTALEHEQRRFQVPVLGFVDDLIGQQAYATKSDLHEWLRESPVVDTIQLKIDPAHADRIYLTLKERPMVAAVTIRKLLLKSFNELVAEMITTFTVILVGFAVAISGAVIFNTTRISLSERGWEMASLRILGFSVKTTFELMFIDIGIQVLLALIPGIAIGYWLSYLSTHMIHNDTFKFPLVIDLSTYGGAVLTMLGIFLVSGLYLYRKMKRLDFSEALKARE